MSSILSERKVQSALPKSIQPLSNREYKFGEEIKLIDEKGWFKSFISVDCTRRLMIAQFESALKYQIFNGF